ncbi:DUF664 domain-containing protein [Nonomuraea polychroma]|nr:DUF664 domain-containing protein [Nonomuraea polychroma]
MEAKRWSVEIDITEAEHAGHADILRETLDGQKSS